MDDAEARAWFGDYLSAFAALGRGEQDEPRLLLDFYAVPLLLTTDAAATVLTSEDDVLGLVQRQIGDLRDAGYDHSEVLSSELSVLNARTALHVAAFSRRRADGTEIGRLAATYLIVAGPVGRRICALVLHAP